MSTSEVESAINGRTAIFISLIAVAAAVLSAAFAYFSYSETKRANLEAHVDRTMIAYLSAFAEASNNLTIGETLQNPEAYKLATTNQKRRTEIVNGLLVQLVDAMYAAEDCRRYAWAQYLQGAQGPSKAGYPIEDYAKLPQTLHAIKNGKSSPLEVERLQAPDKGCS